VLPDGGPTQAQSAVGAVCAEPSQCANLPSPTCKTQNGDGTLRYPGGYCTHQCFPNATSPQDACPADSVCTPRNWLGEPSDSSGWCLRACAAQGECRSGYACRPLGPAGERVCAPVPVGLDAGSARCAEGVVKAPVDQGDTALCRVPSVSCSAAEDVQSVQHCHFPPSPSPAMTCCDPRPAACDPNDCGCLLREGAWLDTFLAADAGISFATYNGPKRKCSYRVSCSPAGDGGVAVLACTPA
jgi:hypothetical protein